MLLHQRHYALVLRLDRRDRLEISALASRGCRLPAVWRLNLVELVHQALPVPRAERSPGAVAGIRPGGTTARQRPAAGGRITASGCACSNRRRGKGLRPAARRADPPRPHGRSRAQNAGPSGRDGHNVSSICPPRQATRAPASRAWDRAATTATPHGTASAASSCAPPAQPPFEARHTSGKHPQAPRTPSAAVPQRNPQPSSQQARRHLVDDEKI